MKLLILDNTDSFTYNLRQLFEEAGCDNINVCNSNEFQVADTEQFDKIVFSPGPGLPEEFPCMYEILSEFGSHKSILGICLGHQAIARFFGGKLKNMDQVVHGKKALMKPISDSPLFHSIPDPFEAGLYHSWIVEETNFPDVLEITVKSADGGIMALKHRQFDIQGVQFHPESFMTTDGLQIVRNWLTFRPQVL